MDEKDFEKLHYQVLDIGRVVQQLADNLTHADALDPDFTLVEVAKIHSCLLNISSKIYIHRPDLVPQHLHECDWRKYIPQ